MKSELRSLIRTKIVDGLQIEIPDTTRRDIYIPNIPNKVLAVIGMRRSGKTIFLTQCLSDHMAGGAPRESLLYFNFEDERLTEMSAGDLQFVVEEYFSLHPERRDKQPVTFMLDEIQIIKGWETFVRRLLDTENIELFVSGSSAGMLSREVASSMRGRAVEVLVHPFSFREMLRHHKAEPDVPFSDMSKSKRSLIEKYFGDYLIHGGFPEAQGLAVRERTMLLRSYVDVAVLRDVIERFNVTNAFAIRWMIGHLLGNPAASFSIRKFHRALQSQGAAIAKNTLYDYLSYLEDAFIVRTVWLHSSSERKRMANPRKSYPVDTGLISIYERSGRINIGHSLETAVFLELERRGYAVSYVRTEEGYEVDFRAENAEGDILLIQVSAEIDEEKTWEREVRALVRASEEFRGAKAILITADLNPPGRPLPDTIAWQSAPAWLLGDEI